VNGVRSCLSCQEQERKRAASWIGQVPDFQMPKIVQLAMLLLKTRDDKDGQGHLTSVSCLEIIAAWHFDQKLKQALATQKYDDWRAENPIIAKEILQDG
jgi:hypothetical protein